MSLFVEVSNVFSRSYPMISYSLENSPWTILLIMCFSLKLSYS